MAERTTATVRLLRQILTKVVNPDVLVSDNRTQLVNTEFCEKQETHADGNI